MNFLDNLGRSLVVVGCVSIGWDLFNIAPSVIGGLVVIALGIVLGLIAEARRP